MSSWRGLRSFSFGDTPALADELLALVLAGCKTATCSAARDGQPTEVGARWVVRDGAGRPRAVIETTELTRRRWNEVDSAFADDEGDGVHGASSSMTSTRRKRSHQSGMSSAKPPLRPK